MKTKSFATRPVHRPLRSIVDITEGEGGNLATYNVVCMRCGSREEGVVTATHGGAVEEARFIADIALSTCCR